MKQEYSKGSETETVENLMDFFDDVMRRGLYPASTILPLRIAVRKIMQETSTDISEWMKVPIGDIKLEERMKVFKAVTNGACSEKTMHVYRTRFERALLLFKREKREQRRLSELRTEVVADELSFLLKSLKKTIDSQESKQSPKNAIAVHDSCYSNTVNLLQKEYTAFLRSRLIRWLEESDFERKNVIYPFVLEDKREAILILPKTTTSAEKTELNERLKAILELTEDRI